jgi:hypothetical protein
MMSKKQSIDIVDLYVCYVCETIGNMGGRCINCGEKMVCVPYVPQEQLARLEADNAALRDLLAAVRETRHLGSFAVAAHVKAALELCEEQLRKVEA